MTGYGIVYLLSPGLYCSKRTAHSILQQTVADIALHCTIPLCTILHSRCSYSEGAADRVELS
jgi:hypothetical protein